METALHDTTQVFLKVLKETPQVETEKENDSLISSLYLDPRYTALKEYIDTIIGQLDRLEGVIEPADSPEVIGFRYMIARVAKSYLITVRDLPETLANAKRADTE